MNLTLDDAIVIHGKVLVAKHKKAAPQNARTYALARKQIGDHDGHEIWLRVAVVAEQLVQHAEMATSEQTNFAPVQ
jgi:hypothetical protein